MEDSSFSALAMFLTTSVASKVTSSSPGRGAPHQQAPGNFTFTALLGLLSLSGMLIKNAIILVEEIDARIAEGGDRAAAVVAGSVSRFRPVVLAAGTTIFGMIPLLADAFFASMAVTIMGGLAFASVLTLIAVPVIYALMFRIRQGRRQGPEATLSPAT